MKEKDFQEEQFYLEEHGHKSIYCSMVLRLMDTKEYSENYADALNLVCLLFPSIEKEKLEEELNKWI